MSTKKIILISAGYAATLILGMVLGPKFIEESASRRNGTFLPFLAGGREDKVVKIFDLIRNNYVDSVNIDSIQERTIAGVLKELDPHSSYLPPRDAQVQTENLEGNYTGIGVDYQIIRDTLMITGVNQNGPAAGSGLKPGDRVLRVDDYNIAGVGMASNKIVDMIRGRAGSAVKLAVKRGAGKDLIVLSVKRGKVLLNSVDIAYMLDPHIGYIRVNRFGARTNEDFADSLGVLMKQGMQSLILDLRENGGGYLSAATGLCDQFLGSKKLIVFTRGAHEPRTDYFSTGEGRFEKGKLVVLIDENTASASEVLAGAVQDLDRGVIIGRRSFGKGLVQEQFNFGDGSALNLTVARYYTPSGRSIQKSYKKGVDAYYHELSDRLATGELNASKHNIDSLYQYGAHFRTASGRHIYGGGGIMPDIYVPIDSTAYSDLYFDLYKNGLLADYIFNYMAKGPAPESLNEVLHNYHIADQKIASFSAYAGSRGVKYSQTAWQAARKHITKEMKALYARYYFGDAGYFRVINAGDETIAKSVEVLKQP